LFENFDLPSTFVPKVLARRDKPQEYPLCFPPHGQAKGNAHRIKKSLPRFPGGGIYFCLAD
jgi:hypothetical protein